MVNPKLASHVVHAASKGSPSIVKEIFYGISLGLAGGAVWKMYHVNLRRKTEEFYAGLEKGVITVDA